MLTVTTMMADSLASALQDFSVTVKTVPTAMNALRELTTVMLTQAVLTSKVIFVKNILNYEHVENKNVGFL